jgi:signal transduction histidine kinase
MKTESGPGTVGPLAAAGGPGVVPGVAPGPAGPPSGSPPSGSPSPGLPPPSPPLSGPAPSGPTPPGGWAPRLVPPIARPVRKLYRDPGNRIVAGVASGLAEHLGLRTVLVRVIFVGLLAANGLGALLYVAFWAVLPAPPRAGPRRRTGFLQRIGLVALAAGVIAVRVQLGGSSDDLSLVALLALIAFGAGTIWHQADPQRRRRKDQAAVPDPVATLPPAAAVRQVEEETRRQRRWFPVRIAGGGLLVVLGIVGILGFFAPTRDGLSAIFTGLVFGVLALAGLALALAPLFYRIFGQLREERVARIREQERAEVAAVVHDQVLHTLALIQRNAGDTNSVVRLARGQERTLRNWLYKPRASPSERFAAALEQVAAEVEDTYGVSVETVVVGDTANDPRVAALVAATREALVNAARHARVGTISLYAEAEEEKLTVFVRDRGAGFDLSGVDEDRQGVRGSIIGRMRRHGGQAEVRSAPGEGTEVALTMPRSGKDSQP